MSEPTCPICGRAVARHLEGAVRTERCPDCGACLGRYFQALESLGGAQKKYSRWEVDAARAAFYPLGLIFYTGCLGGLAGVLGCIVLMIGALHEFLRAPIGIKNSPGSPWLLPAIVAMLAGAALAAVANGVGNKLQELIPRLECPMCYFTSDDRAELTGHIGREHGWTSEAISRWVQRLEASIFGAG